MNIPFDFQGLMKLQALRVWGHRKQLTFQQILYWEDLDKSRIIQEGHAHFLVLYKQQFFWLKHWDQLVVFPTNVIVEGIPD